MPLRGESVGTAYVKILADGEGLDRSIRDELDGIDKDFDEKGREHAEKYDKEMEKQLKKDAPRNQEAIDKMFEKHGAKARALAKEIDSELFKQLDKDIREGHGDILGDRMMRDIRRGFVEGGGWKAFGKDFQHLFDQLPEITKRANAEIVRENRALEKERVERFQHSVSEIEAGYARIVKGSKNATTGQRDSLHDTIRDLRALRTELSKTPSLGGKDHGETARLLRDMERGLGKVHPGLRTFRAALDGSAVGMGRAFGKTSRNDFLNFAGGMVEGLSKIPGRVIGVTEGIMNIPKTLSRVGEEGAKFFTTFLGGIQSGAGPLKALQSSFAGIETAGTGMASSLLAGAVAIPVLVVVIGTLVAAASLLLGVLVALASTISFALVGALGVALGLLGPVAAVVGVLALAFLGLGKSTSEAHKQLSAFLKPVTSQLKDLALVTKQHLFAGLKEDGAAFGKGLGNLKPLIVDTADALSKMFTEVANAAASDGFKKYMDKITPIIDQMLPKLGAAAGHTTRAIGGIFLGVLPSANDFLTSLDKLTRKFDKWANSADGQNQIKKFMDDAKESAISLGHFIGQVSGLLGDLLFNSEGKKTGDSLFDSMADAVKRFRAYIKDGGLEKWFKDAKKFGEDLGRAIANVGKVLDALDSPTFRSFAITSIKFFSDLLAIIDDIVRPVTDLVQSVNGLLHLDWSKAGTNLKNFVPDFGSLLSGSFDVLKWAMPAVKFATDIAGIIQTVWSKIDWSGLGRGIVNGLRVGLSDTGTVIGGVMSAIGSGLADGSKAIVSGAISLGSKVGHGIADGFNYANRKADEFNHFVAGKVGDLASSIGSKVSSMSSDLRGRLGSAWDSTKNKASSMASSIRSSVGGALSSVGDKASSAAKKFSGTLSSGFDAAKSAAGGVRSAIRSIGDGISYTVGKIQSLISWLGKIHIPGGAIGKLLGKFGVKTGGVVDMFGLHRVQKMAAGGLANFAQNYQIGEAGREAIVPLDRPLGQVDPAVRLLSAFAQGKLGNYTTDRSRNIDASGWQIITPTKDPAAVAQETLDALAAKIH